MWQKDLTIFMDSAETRGLQELISGNNARMDLQEENMLNTGRAVQALVAQVFRAHNPGTVTKITRCATHTA